jgi:hypothetical protein
LKESSVLRRLAPASLALTMLVATGLGLSGCGSDSGGDAVSKDSSGTPTIDITIKGKTVTPDGTKVEVEKGKPVKLHIVADAAGEIHVHSEPEQEIEYEDGTTDKTLTLDQPGVVDVEVHTLDKLVVQLEVR